MTCLLLRMGSFGFITSKDHTAFGDAVTFVKASWMAVRGADLTTERAQTRQRTTQQYFIALADSFRLAGRIKDVFTGQNLIAKRWRCGQVEGGGLPLWLR